MSKAYHSLKDIEWTPTNIALIVGALSILICGVMYGLNESQRMKKEKEKKFRVMSLDKIADYIIEHNQGTFKIDSITSIKDISYNDGVLEFPYYVADSFLLHRGIPLPRRMQKFILQNDTLDEDCDKAAFKVFYKKAA